MKKIVISMLFILNSVYGAQNRLELANGNLLRAARYADIAKAQKALENGANIESIDEDDQNFTPLITAAVYGHIKMVTFLIEKGANINATDIENHTALMWAADRGYIKVAQFLIQNGANKHIIDNTGLTTLHWAHFGEQEQIVRSLKIRKREE